MKLETYAKNIDGKLVFTYPNHLEEFLSKLPDGAEIQLKMSSVKDSKTIKQLRLLYRIYGVIADYMGETVHAVHVYLKNMFLPPEVIEVQGVTILECQTLSTIPKKDMVLYITNVINWSASYLNLMVVNQEDWEILK